METLENSLREQSHKDPLKCISDSPGKRPHLSSESEQKEKAIRRKCDKLQSRIELLFLRYAEFFQTQSDRNCFSPEQLTRRFTNRHHSLSLKNHFWCGFC
ncbi:hypothetical protein CDAR_430311 [Caerostris darwini]|uniref:Uncharacterized protein n=1 Tax=Caerostris darwini TaxID=1538125 RepID=A0AAV4TYJ5_9ARAC|nr:hypothetical protein CDAR_430311 [Caerostris darwini]